MSTCRRGEMEQWLISNYAYGHLDDMPDWVLMELLRDTSGLYGAWFCQASMTKTDSIEELCSMGDKVTWPEAGAANANLRWWVIVERLKRMGRLQLTRDVLIKELATSARCGLELPNGKTFNGTIVEVSHCRVMMVGEAVGLLERKAV